MHKKQFQITGALDTMIKIDNTGTKYNKITRTVIEKHLGVLIIRVKLKTRSQKLNIKDGKSLKRHVLKSLLFPSH